MSGNPTDSYLICTTPRSGSTLLCEMLAGTGVAGRPDEYFQQLRATGLPMTARDYLDGVAADLVPRPRHETTLEQHTLYDPRRFAGFEEYVEWVLRRATTPNGVFAAKIMWPYMDGLVAGLSTIPRHHGIEAPDELLAHAFPRLRYVWLRRLDKVRQAVSLWRAIQTWSWRQDAAQECNQTGSARLRYSFEAVDHLRRQLIACDRAWESYFEATGIEPLTLTYEDFVRRMPETVTQLLGHVGATCPRSVGCGAPRTARQSDQVSEQWVADFRAEFDGRVPAVR